MKLKKNNVNETKYLYLLLILFFLLVINFHIIKKEKKIKFEKNCYLSFENSDLKIIHIIITRFAIGLFSKNDTTKDFILNGFRVMKKYLLPSLENQSCKDFIWILILGDKANITFIKSLFKFNNSFQKYILYAKDLKKFLRNITKGFDILITTRIDYDDRIYYDAVNDVRKDININKPIFFHGYNRGLYFFELDNKYYDFEFKIKSGAYSVFESVIIILNKVKDTYTIYDFGVHYHVKTNLLKYYKAYGINKPNYDIYLLNSP